MGLNKPTKPAWAYGDVQYVIEPPLGHKNTGWKSKQKPPFQYMNWIQLKNYQWQNWSEERAEFLESVSFHTVGGSVTWSGADIVVPAGGLVIEWRARDLLISNILPEATYALADGEYLVFIPHETPAHALTLGTYATLVPGQYAIIASSDFVDNLNYTEVILFKRRGAVVGTAILEVPLFKTAVQSGGALASNDLLVHHHTDADDGGQLDHGTALTGLGDDDHTQYAHLNKASQTFLQTISGQTPTLSGHLATKGYVDGLIPSMAHVCEDNVSETVSAAWTFSSAPSMPSASFPSTLSRAYSQSLCKAWGFITTDGDGYVVSSNLYNCTISYDNANDVYYVTFTTEMANATYPVLGTAGKTADGDYQGTWSIYVSAGNRSAAGFYITCQNEGGGKENDNAQWSFVVVG